MPAPLCQKGKGEGIGEIEPSPLLKETVKLVVISSSLQSHGRAILIASRMTETRPSLPLDTPDGFLSRESTWPVESSKSYSVTSCSFLHGQILSPGHHAKFIPKEASNIPPVRGGILGMPTIPAVQV